jgi:hypothetical protein
LAGFADRGFQGVPARSWGYANNPVQVVNWNDFNSIDAQAPPPPNLNWATAPTSSIHERSAPFASRFGALGQPVTNWSNVPSYRGPSDPWAPGPAVANITVNPSRSNPGTFAQPATAQSYGLPAATYPGASPSTIDWQAIADSGISSMISNTRGTVSPELMAYEQSRFIPQQHTAADGYQSWWSPGQGFVDPQALADNATRYNTPYQQTSTDGFTSWVHPQRGNISADDPEVLALLRRG